MNDETSVRADALRRRNPSHPGHSIREGCVDALPVCEAALKLDVSRNTLSRVLNGRRGISPEMALKLEAVGWSNADFRVRRQAHYELAQARKRLAAKTRAG